MSKASNQELEDSLKSYSIAIDYWESLAGDTFLYIGQREFLGRHWTDLSADQKKALAVADEKALALVAQQYDEITEDIEDLRLIATIINAKPLPKGGSGFNHD